MITTQTTLTIENKFSLTPLSNKTTVVRIRYDESLLHPKYPKPDYSWLIIDASLASMSINREDGAVTIKPHVAQPVSLIATKLPETFATELNSILAHYKKPETKEAVEKQLKAHDKTFNGTF